MAKWTAAKRVFNLPQVRLFTESPYCVENFGGISTEAYTWKGSKQDTNLSQLAGAALYLGAVLEKEVFHSGVL